MSDESPRLNSTLERPVSRRSFLGWTATVSGGAVAVGSGLRGATCGSDEACR